MWLKSRGAPWVVGGAPPSNCRRARWLGKLVSFLATLVADRGFAAQCGDGMSSVRCGEPPARGGGPGQLWPG